MIDHTQLSVLCFWLICRQVLNHLVSSVATQWYCYSLKPGSGWPKNLEKLENSRNFSSSFKYLCKTAVSSPSVKAIFAFTFCCDNLRESKLMALEKPGKLTAFFLLLCGHPVVLLRVEYSLQLCGTRAV